MSEERSPHISKDGSAIFIYGHACEEWDGEIYLADHRDDGEYPHFYIEGKRFREGNIEVHHMRALYEWLRQRLEQQERR